MASFFEGRALHDVVVPVNLWTAFFSVSSISRIDEFTVQSVHLASTTGQPFVFVMFKLSCFPFSRKGEIILRASGLEFDFKCSS